MIPVHPSQRRSRSILWIACSVALAAAPIAGAGAQPAGDRAAAEAVFREGRELMEGGRPKDACPMFEKSLALFQSASAALNLAKCYAATDRLAAALTTIDRAIELNKLTEDDARRAELARLTTTQRESLVARVPTVRIHVTPFIQGMTIERNGIEIPQALLGQPIPVDPGTTTIRVKAPGYKDFLEESVVGEGQALKVDIVLTRDHPVGEPITAPSNAKPAGQDQGSSEPDTANTTWPWIVGGTGIAVLAIGIGFAIDYGIVRGELNETCPEGRCSGISAADASSLLDRWDRDVVGLALGGGLGAALIISGAVGLATLPSSSPNTATTLAVTPVASHTFVGLNVTGGF